MRHCSPRVGYLNPRRGVHVSQENKPIVNEYVDNVSEVQLWRLTEGLARSATLNAMTERIYTRDREGRLEPLEEEHFAKEDELQALIAEHPEVLDGEQMRPGDPLRWILITREQGIAESSSDAAARWSVDHLVVDQDAVPTLVEVKRGSNPEIRRTIVGQMLEYAAHAARTWTSDTLRRAFEESTTTRGLDPGEELGKLLMADGEPDADGFWERVATNLAATRLRLLFVADDIPDPLERVVEFLNAQMAGIEVLAVEIKQFKGHSSQTLVPRVSEEQRLHRARLAAAQDSTASRSCRPSPTTSTAPLPSGSLALRVNKAPTWIGIPTASASRFPARFGSGRSASPGSFRRRSGERRC